MSQDKNTTNFLFVLSISLLNVTLAYIFSKSGYEAFITVSFALGVLLTASSFSTLSLIFRSSYKRIVKLICVLLIAFTWCILIAGIFSLISLRMYSLHMSLPQISWWLVIVGALPYLLPRLLLLHSKQSLNYSILSMVTVIYSVSVLFIAAVNFNSSEAAEKNIMLILGVQLQYLMNYAVLRTNYINKSLEFANRTVGQLNLHNKNSGAFLVVLIVGLPFILPVALILIPFSWQ